MKLFYAATSPFVRKVVIVAHERGLFDELTLVPAQASPIDANREIVAQNPAGKVPTLVLDDGSALFDSRVIAEYIDAINGPKLFPSAGTARWSALSLQSLADEMTDAALLARYETTMRPQALRWDAWVDGAKGKIVASVAQLNERWIEELTGEITIGSISVACALGYLDFRFGDMAWRNGNDRLAAWYESFAARPSMSSTIPPG